MEKGIPLYIFKRYNVLQMFFNLVERSLLVISYRGHFLPRFFSFLPWSFRTYCLIISNPVTTIAQVISYPFWPFRTHFGHKMNE